MKISIIINIISILAALSWPLPAIAKEPPSLAQAAGKTPAHPKNWDNDTRAVYDLLLAQMQSADTDYAGSVDTLVKFARTQKNDGLYAKAYKALLQTERYSDAAMLCKIWQQQSKHKGINKFYVLALTLNGDIDQAVNATLQALKSNPGKGQHTDSDDNMDNIERALYPYLQMLVSHWYQPSVTEVIARLYEAYPDSELVAIMYVKQLRWQGQLEKAVDIVDKRRFNDPKNLGLVQEISDIYRYAVRLDEADKVWQQLLADYPNEAEFQFAYAQFLFDRYDFAGAEKTLATIGDSNLETQVNTLKIMTAIQLDKYAEAEAIFANHFTDTAEKQRARYNLANSLLQQKQYDLAKKYFQPLVDFNDENPRDPDIDNEFALPAALKIAPSQRLGKGRT
ncbi:MAG: hypothetical protein CSA45_01300 [Gammaproteobacteria bacterium]|nr:MAG: hypothetical protein CSA45_01300 [Gammaproteobacteria bacterium]